jgi:hypothetical protein
MFSAVTASRCLTAERQNGSGHTHYDLAQCFYLILTCRERERGKQLFVVGEANHQAMILLEGGEAAVALFR